jgi:hypothetical protein
MQELETTNFARLPQLSLVRWCRSCNASVLSKHYKIGQKKGPFETNGPKSREETPKEGCDARASSGVTIHKLYVQRTIRNCIFCNAARTKPGSLLSHLSHVARDEAVTASKKSRPYRRHESREETPNGRWCFGGAVTSHSSHDLVRRGQQADYQQERECNSQCCQNTI